MAGSVNKVILIGRLGKDPEMRFTPAGQQVTNFSVATDRRYTTAEGEKKIVTTWFNIEVWGKLAEVCNQYLHKGNQVGIIGRLKDHGWYDKVWQAYAALVPVRTVGVKGDERSYEWAVSLRAVVSQDAMTADWVELPYSILRETSHRILNEVKGVNRVLYDVSTKPPASIEWE